MGIKSNFIKLQWICLTYPRTLINETYYDLYSAPNFNNTGIKYKCLPFNLYLVTSHLLLTMS